MTQPDYETKDVHTNMMADGEGFETKDLPGGYRPAAVPNSDRTGTQKEEAASSEEASSGDESAEGSTSSGSSTTSRKTSTSKSSTSSASGSK